MIHIKVLYFGPAADAAGGREEIVGLDDSSTVQSLRSILFASHPELARQEEILRFAVNLDYVDIKRPLADGDEVAVIPPVAGGTADLTVALTHEAIEFSPMINRVSSIHAGAVTTFLGTVRAEGASDHPLIALEYTAYEEMARRKLRQIGEEALERFELTAIDVVHRLGRMELGVASVAIVLSSPHRKDGFAACQYIMDRIKEDVPIWKSEIWQGGETSWVNPTADI